MCYDHGRLDNIWEQYLSYSVRRPSGINTSSVRDAISYLLVSLFIIVHGRKKESRKTLARKMFNLDFLAHLFYQLRRFVFNWQVSTTHYYIQHWVRFGEQRPEVGIGFKFLVQLLTATLIQNCHFYLKKSQFSRAFGTICQCTQSSDFYYVYTFTTEAFCKEGRNRKMLFNFNRLQDFVLFLFSWLYYNVYSKNVCMQFEEMVLTTS